MTIVSSVRQMVETPIYAINEGTSPILSYNYGAKRPKLVRDVYKRQDMDRADCDAMKVSPGPKLFAAVCEHDPSRPVIKGSFCVNCLLYTSNENGVFMNIPAFFT